MAKKNKPDTRGFVFSTDPNFSFEEENEMVLLKIIESSFLFYFRQLLRLRKASNNRILSFFIRRTRHLQRFGENFRIHQKFLFLQEF